MSELVSSALIQIIVLSAPFLIVGLLIGLAIGVFQATTQIQDSALSFVPKLLLLLLLVIFGLPWFMEMISDYTVYLYKNVTMSTG